MSGRIAVFCAALAALLILAPAQSRAAMAPDGVTQQIHTFATCAGRMMALRDHLALFGHAGVDEAEARREAHVSILDALMEMAGEMDGRTVTRWRIHGRAAQGSILSQSAFGTTEASRNRAAKIAERHVAHCDRLILGA